PSSDRSVEAVRRAGPAREWAEKSVRDPRCDLLLDAAETFIEERAEERHARARVGVGADRHDNAPKVVLVPKIDLRVGAAHAAQREVVLGGELAGADDDGGGALTGQRSEDAGEVSTEAILVAIGDDDDDVGAAQVHRRAVRCAGCAGCAGGGLTGGLVFER